MSNRAGQQATINQLRGRLTDAQRAATQAMMHAFGVEQAAQASMAEVAAKADEQIQALTHDLQLTVAALSQYAPHNNEVVQEVLAERARQDTLHGVQDNLDDVICHLFTMEEVGEVSKALLEREVAIMRGADAAGVSVFTDQLYTEIIQTAACFVKWAQIIKARRVSLVPDEAGEEQDDGKPRD